MSDQPTIAETAAAHAALRAQYEANMRSIRESQAAAEAAQRQAEAIRAQRAA